MAPCDGRGVNRCGHAHLACKFPINVTVPTELSIDTGSFLGIGATRYRVTSEQIQEVKPDGLVLTLKETEVKSVPQAGEKQQ